MSNDKAAFQRVLGMNLTRYRMAKDLSQQQVATRARIHISTYQRIENSQASTNAMVLRNLADALGTSLDALVV